MLADLTGTFELGTAKSGKKRLVNWLRSWWYIAFYNPTIKVHHIDLLPWRGYSRDPICSKLQPINLHANANWMFNLHRNLCVKLHVHFPYLHINLHANVWSKVLATHQSTANLLQLVGCVHSIILVKILLIVLDYNWRRRNNEQSRLTYKLIICLLVSTISDVVHPVPISLHLVYYLLV